MKNRDEKNFISIANEIGELVQEKNIAYGDSFAKSQEIVKVLYPDGVKPEQYMDMLAITRVIDKLFRIATKKDAFGESPWRDICGYAILGIANDEEEAKAKPIKTNAEIWEEQEYDIRDEKVRASITQKIRDKRHEGHGNPYANIDRESESESGSGSRSEQEKKAMGSFRDRIRGTPSNIHETNAEGHKEKDCKDKENKAVVSFDEWNRYVSSSSEKEKS